MSAFETELERLGVACIVEERGRLAILRPVHSRGSSTADPSLSLVVTAARRRALVAAGRANGFANVCIELDAALSGD